MKKFLMAVILTLLSVSLSYAAGTVVVKKGQYLNGDVKTLTFTWTAASGTVTAVPTTTEETNFIKGYYLCAAVTNPGSEAPDADYDITITDADGVDLFGTALTNRSATTSEYAVPTVATSVKGCAFVDGTLTVNWANVGTGSENGTLKLYFAKP